MRRYEEYVIFFHAPTQKKHTSFWESCYDWMDSFVCAVLAVFLIFTFFFRPVRVDGDSMNPTLQHESWLLVSDWNFQADYGDVVIVTPTLTTSKTLHENIVKRIIARGGDTIDIDYDKNTVSVNGKVLEEPYRLEQDLRKSTRADLYSMPMTIPQGYVFVMGDNRNDSLDSRFSAVGLVDERYLMGEAKGVLFPIGNWQIAPGADMGE